MIFIGAAILASHCGSRTLARGNRVQVALSRSAFLGAAIMVRTGTFGNLRRICCPAYSDRDRTGKDLGETMSFALWRGVVGMVRPTRRPGTLEELIRILPEGIGIVPLLLNFKAGSTAEFQKSIPLYERFVAELAEQGVDLIIPAGAPPFMLLGYEGEAQLIRRWEKKYKTEIVTDPQMQVAGLRAMGIKKFIGASYSTVQNKIVLDYMAQAGLKAVSMEPIDVPFDQVAQISTQTLYAHIKNLFRKHRGADGIYIQGGGWQTARVVEMLETDLQVPVVHATICEAWQIHKRLSVRETAPGYGRLLAELP
jgi:maleate cis-trans isomerase